ncbi:MAG TPA: acyclic terpene utilization AtuA family protein [Alphaproteobacteria bacterium]|nr:acyclic terpene utilization AtuA family protein [Alphaproteobacteria bacterium]
METVRIGCGAGFAGDRLEPALLLAERGQLDYLALECLGERTVALAQLRKRHDPSLGYDPMLERRMAGLLPLIKANGVRLITNMGAANPLAAARKTAEIARRADLRLRVAAVTGDDVLEALEPDHPTMETGAPLRSFGELVSANAYLGIEALLPALEGGADVIISGRVADPSLFLAPLVHRFGWSLDDHDRLGRGTMVGHLLECAGQLTGGYFADPGCKDVPGMASLGFPFADVDGEGNARISKLPGTGGVITRRTATEQLLYEVTNPSAYVTPDVVADFSGVTLREDGENAVVASGARGKPRPGTLKVSVGYHAGYVGEGEIGYAGENCVARGKLAGEIVRERLGNQFRELRIDLVGLSALHSRPMSNGKAHEPYEVRLRVAGRAPDEETARRVGEEVEALYTNGPAGGGGARKQVHEQIGIVSCLIPRERVTPRVEFLEA